MSLLLLRTPSPEAPSPCHSPHRPPACPARPSLHTQSSHHAPGAPAAWTEATCLLLLLPSGLTPRQVSHQELGQVVPLTSTRVPVVQVRNADLHRSRPTARLPCTPLMARDARIGSGSQTCPGSLCGPALRAIPAKWQGGALRVEGPPCVTAMSLNHMASPSSPGAELDRCGHLPHGNAPPGRRGPADRGLGWLPPAEQQPGKSAEMGTWGLDKGRPGGRRPAHRASRHPHANREPRASLREVFI